MCLCLHFKVEIFLYHQSWVSKGRRDFFFLIWNQQGLQVVSFLESWGYFSATSCHSALLWWLLPCTSLLHGKHRNKIQELHRENKNEELWLAVSCWPRAAGSTNVCPVPPHPGEGSGNTPLISSLWLFPTRQEGFLQGGRTCGSLKCRVLGCTLQLKARCVFTGTCSEWMFQPGMLTWQSLNASQPPNWHRNAG